MQLLYNDFGCTHDYMHAWDQIACSGDKIHIAPILFKNTKKNLVKPWQENEEYKWWTKNQNLQFHTIKKWLYEQILCLPLCQSQTVPTSPLTVAAWALGLVGAAAPSAREGQGQHYKKIVKALRARTKKGTTQARRAHQARAPLQRSTGRRAGARASRYGRAIAFPRPRGEESREKKWQRKCT